MCGIILILFTGGSRQGSFSDQSADRLPDGGKRRHTEGKHCQECICILFHVFWVRAFNSGFGSVVEQGQFLFSLGLLVLEAVC